MALTNLSAFLLAALQSFDGLPAPTGPTTGPMDLTERFEVPPGVTVNLWSQSPLLFNPTAIDVDARGRVWVAEGVNYRRWGGRNPGLEHPRGERIVVLSDFHGDGRGSHAEVFVEDPDLVVPLGIAVFGNRVFVSCSPNLYVYTDDDLDGKSDRRATFLTGFGGHDHDHGLHSVVYGPDLRLWFNAGNAGPHLVQDRGGFHLRSGSLYRDGGAVLADNKPGLVSSDGRVWTGGLVLSIDEDGSGLAVHSHNFRNNYELALDAFGNVFQSDNDDDGNRACRALWCLEGGNHGYFSADGARMWGADRRPGQDTWNAHWHAEDPGVVPPGLRLGAGGPTGVAVYESDRLGAWLDGRLLCADAGAGKVYALRPRAAGAGFEFEPGVLIAARATNDDGERRGWFRPSDVCAAPDGTIYVADWSDPGVGGHAMADRQAHGRILRLVPTGQWVYPRHYELAHVAGRIEALASPSPNVRALAARALVTARSMEARAALTGLFEGDAPRLRARALWLLARIDGPRTTALAAALKDADADLRVTAVRALRAVGGDVLQHAPALAADPSPAVRRELCVALRGVPLERSRAALLALARGYDGEDRAYLEAFGLAAEEHAAALWPDLVAQLGDPDPLRWSPAFAGLAWRLHPEAAVPGLAARARDAALPLAERRRMTDALAFVEARAAGEAMVDLAVSGPEDLRELARWWVKDRDTTTWKGFDLARQVGRGEEQGVVAWSSGIVTRGAVGVDVDVTGARTLWLVATEGEKGQSCDWIAWLEPRVEHARGVLQLSGAEWTRAEAAWGSVRRGKNCTGGPIVVDGRTWTEGLGSHAHSVIAFELPPDARRFTARAAVDDAGSGQGDQSDVEFRVLLDAGVLRARIAEHARTLGDDARSAAEVAAAAAALCATSEGGFEALRLARADALSERARAAVATRIRECPDLAVRALAAAEFPAEGDAPRPATAAVLALEGSAARGMPLFFGKGTCGQCHAFHGRGADIGPDLSAVHAKSAPEVLVDSILSPSAAIAFGYDTWLVETTDETLHAGFLIRDDDLLVLRDTLGRRHAIQKDEVAARVKQTVSAMPDAASLGLAPQDVADLVAFLRSEPRVPGRRGEPVRLFNGRDLTGWGFHLTDPDARAEDVWSVRDGVLRCAGSPVGYLRTEGKYTNFVLELEWRFDPEKGAGNSGVLLRRTGPDKVWPRSLEAQLMSRNAGDIWNIDAFPAVADPERTQGRRTEKLLPCNEKPLGEWNRYRITLDGGELTLEVNGEVQNRASWCLEEPGEICLQSEGAWIEFRNVVLTPIERSPH